MKTFAVVCIALAMFVPRVAVAQAPAVAIAIDVAVPGQSSDLPHFTVLDDGKPVRGLHVSRAKASGPLVVLIDTTCGNCVRSAHAYLQSAGSGVDVWDVSEVKRVSGEPDGVERDAQLRVRDHAERRWMAILFAVMAKRGSEHGRKEAIYFTADDEGGGLPPDGLTAFLSDAAHSEFSLYAIAHSQLDANTERSLAKLQKKDAADVPLQGTSGTIHDLALGTGGMYAMAGTQNASDLLAAVSQDFSRAYELQYTTDTGITDGHFRKLEVKSSNPGATVRGPSGYAATPVVSFYTLAGYEVPLYSELGDASAKPLFPVESSLVAFRSNGQIVAGKLVVDVPLENFQREQAQGEQASQFHFSLLAVVSTQDGSPVITRSDDIVYSAADPESVYTFVRSVALPPGDYQVTVAVQDRNSGRTSRAYASASVDGSDEDTRFGDLVLVRGATHELSGEHDDPFELGNAQVIPFASGTIALRQPQLPVVVSLYVHPGLQPPFAELNVKQGETVVQSIPLTIRGDADGCFRALALLDRSVLKAGHYSLVARAIDDEHVHEQKREIDVSLDQAASPEADTFSLLSVEAPAKAVETWALSADDFGKVIQKAREYADNYARRLPGFACVETTEQFTTTTNHPKDWHAANVYSEILRYSGGQETYRTVEFNGVRSSLDHDQLPGVRVNGAFGQLLHAVYAPGARADFRLKGKSRIDGADVYVVAYAIKRENSSYLLDKRGSPARLQCAFEGQVYIDTRTFGTRYISVHSVDVPKEARYPDSLLTLKYELLSFEGEHYLLPKRASMTVLEGRRKLNKDEIQFSDYHRYDTATKIHYAE